MKVTDSQSDKIERFKQIQKNLGLKQKDFADKIGLTQSKVSLINNGKAGINILNEIFYRLHFEFGISKNWWDTGKGEMMEKANGKPISSNSNPDEFISNHNLSTVDADESQERYEALNRKYIKLLEEYTQLLKSKLDQKS